MRYLSQTNPNKFKNKKVLVRVDVNVPIGNDGIVDDSEDWRIQAIVPTINLLKKNQAKIALLSHLGRPQKLLSLPAGEVGGHLPIGQAGSVNSLIPEQRKELAKFSLIQLIPKLEEHLGSKVRFVGDCLDSQISEHLDSLEENEILLLENVRFYKEEKENNLEFAKKLIKPFDFYVNEAFSVSHRKNASVAAIKDLKETYLGLQAEKEIQMFEKVLKGEIEKPMLAIIGGTKAETKIPLINGLSKSCAKILIGGATGNEILDNKNKYKLDFSKVELPKDFIPDDQKRLDIGKQTIDEFLEQTKLANTIVWNGPLGMFEKEEYKQGTLKILKEIFDSKVFLIVGGGDSLKFLEQEALIEKVQQNGFISTGGGAMLQYLAGEEMPGL